MTKQFIVGAAMGILSTLLGVSAAKADCDRDYEVQGLVVADYSYAEAFAHGREGRYTECADEAEMSTCARSEGLECAREMQVVYSACVAELVCDEWVQGALEDELVVGDAAIGDAYSSCVRLVMAAGGRF